jgi:hypothetical protein
MCLSKCTHSLWFRPSLHPMLIPSKPSTTKTNASQIPAAPARSRIGTLALIPSMVVLRSSAHVLDERHQEGENAQRGEWAQTDQGEPPERL